MLHLFADAATAAAPTVDLNQLGAYLATIAGAIVTAAVTVMFHRLVNWMTGHNGSGVVSSPPVDASSPAKQ